MFEEFDWECDMCKTGSGHCYGAAEKCSCGCRFYPAQKMASKFIENSTLKKYKNPEKIIEKVLVSAADQGFEDNKKLYEYVKETLYKMAEYNNLNTKESQIRNR